MYNFWEPEFWEGLDLSYPWPQVATTSLDVFDSMGLGPSQRLRISRAAELSHQGRDDEAETFRVGAGYGGMSR